MINFTEQVMPVRIFGLFGLHHGLEIELKSKVKESIQEEAFFDYKNRSYEIQSYSLTGNRRYINVRQIPNPGLYPTKKRLAAILEVNDFLTVIIRQSGEAISVEAALHNLKQEEPLWAKVLEWSKPWW